MANEHSSGDLVPVTPILDRWIRDNSVSSQGQLHELLDEMRTRAEIRLDDSRFTPEVREPNRGMLTRLRGLAATERELMSHRHPAASWDLPPRFPIVVSQHCESGIAFDVARQVATLDMAFRRADAAMRELVAPVSREPSWPRPTHPNKCGLLALDARAGSVDLVLTLYGSLVSMAESAPVALAAMTSLIWDATKTARRIGSRWSARIHRPGGGTDEHAWVASTTAKVVPVLRSAVEAGVPVDFRLSTASGDSISIAVFPPTDGLEGTRGLGNPDASIDGQKATADELE